MLSTGRTLCYKREKENLDRKIDNKPWDSLLKWKIKQSGKTYNLRIRPEVCTVNPISSSRGDPPLLFSLSLSNWSSKKDENSFPDTSGCGGSPSMPSLLWLIILSIFSLAKFCVTIVKDGEILSLCHTSLIVNRAAFWLRIVEKIFFEISENNTNAWYSSNLTDPNS